MAPAALPDGMAEGLEIDRKFSRQIRQLSRAGENETVIRLLRERIDAGEARPWMFEVLGLTLQLTGADEEEVADAVLGGFSPEAADPPALLAAATYMHQLGLDRRAVELCQQASEAAPDAAKPYGMALEMVAPDQRPLDAIWAAAGVLRTAWGTRAEPARERAELIAVSALRELRRRGDAAALASANAQLADAQRADLIVRVRWSGDADVDLTVTEPPGTVTGPTVRRSAAGGVLVRDGFGPDRATAVEEYRAPVAFSGVYLLDLGLTTGEPVGQRVRVEVVRHFGSPSESVEEFTVPLKAVHTPALITLRGGRRVSLTSVDADAPPPRARRLRLADLTDQGAGVASGRGFGPPPGVNNQITAGGGSVGYQPNVQLISEGIASSATAVVSADRRYVRLSLAPQFTNVIDVFNFTFAGTNTGVSGGGGGGFPPAGGGFGGPTPGN
ncbi:hypothetical protein [Alienimonas californiensis]|uniref:Uncharacterized protein n=1 Tax=Alienimonas californiensis TaxID=2527989 RepID=A0A517PCX3_9PLAN|nr:hypothetical protein [Alienimonas californiensis]QDT17228.1 hypothetical protein CA12_33410 [Alienimonas californiensis]